MNCPVSLPVKLWNPMLEPAEMKELYLVIGGKETFVVSIHLYIFPIFDATCSNGVWWRNGVQSLWIRYE